MSIRVTTNRVCRILQQQCSRSFVTRPFVNSIRNNVANQSKRNSFLQFENFGALQQRRRLYYDRDRGKFSVDPTMLLIVAVGATYFLVKGVFVSMYVDQFGALYDSKGVKVPMKRKLVEELYRTLNDANISSEYKTMDLANFEFGRGLQPSVESSFLSRFSVYFLLPVQFNYMLDGQSDEDNQADVRQFCQLMKIDANVLESHINDKGETMLAELVEALHLSKEARRYVLLSLLHSATIPVEPFVHFLILVLAPLGISYAVNAVFNRSERQRALTQQFRRSIAQQSLATMGVVVGYLVAAALFPILSVSKYRFGDWSIVKNECQDRLDADKLLNGAREYFAKREQLEQIVTRFGSCSRNTITGASKLGEMLYSSGYASREQLASLETFVSSKGQ